MRRAWKATVKFGKDWQTDPRFAIACSIGFVVGYLWRRARAGRRRAALRCAAR